MNRSPKQVRSGGFSKIFSRISRTSWQTENHGSPILFLRYTRSSSFASSTVSNLMRLPGRFLTSSLLNMLLRVRKLMKKGVRLHEQAFSSYVYSLVKMFDKTYELELINI